MTSELQHKLALNRGVKHLQALLDLICSIQWIGFEVTLTQQCSPSALWQNIARISAVPATTLAKNATEAEAADWLNQLLLQKDIRNSALLSISGLKGALPWSEIRILEETTWLMDFWIHNVREFVVADIECQQFLAITCEEHGYYAYIGSTH